MSQYAIEAKSSEANTMSELEKEQDSKHIETTYNTRANDAAQDTLSKGKNPWKVLLANPRALAVVMAVQSNAIIVGVEFSLPGNLLGIPAFNKEFGVFSESLGSYSVAANVLAIWAALFATFQIIGQFYGGWLSDRFGRRVCLYGVVFWTLIGVMLEVIATTWQTWLGSKIVIGFATGQMQAVVPTYVSEVSPRELRGVMLSFFNMAMNIGGLAATLIPWATNNRWGGDINDLRAYRVPLYVALASPVLTLIAEFFLLVESPYWLLMKGRVEQCRKSLVFLNPKDTKEEIESKMASLEYTLEKEAAEAELAAGTTYLDCFRGVDLRRTFCAVFPPITQNLSGQNLAGTYATYFFTLAGQKDPLLSSVITTVVGLSANFASFFLIENRRIGRWLLLFVGVIVMTLCMLAIALIDTIKKSVYNYGSGVALTFFVALFIAASTVGPGVVGWAYTAESGSSRLRSKTTALGTMGNALIGLIMTTCLPYLLTKIGAKTGFMFFGLGFVCCFGIYFLIPDTTGRSYAQLDECFYKRVPARKFKSFECNGDYGRDLNQPGAAPALEA